MPPIKQYLRVKRVSFRDFFLLGQIDRIDGKPFRPGDVVAACKECRQVSKRAHWLENACPFCGGTESLLFQGKRELLAGAQPPVAYSSRRFSFRALSPIGRIRLGAAAALAIALILFLSLWRGPGKGTGFYQTDDGHVFYLADGTRYQEGTYRIDGELYRFAGGVLAQDYDVVIHGKRYLTDENGLLQTGWRIHDNRLVYQDENGVDPSRVYGMDGEGFYELEGFGSVYLTAQGALGQGWQVYENGLYHLKDGVADPVSSMPGRFDSRGRYFPQAAGFVETEQGAYFLDSSAAVRTGYVAHQGFVYLIDDQTYLRRILNGDKLEGFTSGYTGALIPQEDRIVSCLGGSVILQARTGAVQTGWTLLDGALYCAGSEGYLRCGESCDDPKGRFDASGRFLPEASGRIRVEGLTCAIRPDGSLVTGCQKEGNALYVYDENGRLRVNAAIGSVGVTDAEGALRPYAAGMYEIEGHFYCLSARGEVLTGWQRLGRLYYFDPETGRRASSGVLADGSAYTLDADGAFVPPGEGLYTLGDGTYYLAKDGSLLTGWQAVSGQMMYFDEQTGKRQADAAEEMQTGWLLRSGRRYYIQPDGTPASGWQLIDDYVYYFDPVSGAALSGTVTLDGTLYTFREDGALMPASPQAVVLHGVSTRIGVQGQKEGGFLYANGHLYYYDLKTAALSAELPRGIPGLISALGGYVIPTEEGVLSIGKDSYYLNRAGDVLTGWFIRENQLYFADPLTGRLPADGDDPARDGFFQNGVFHFRQDGLFQADGRQYLFSQGRLVNGWFALENGVGYMRGDDGRVAGQTIEIDGKSCHFDSEGRYIPGQNTLVLVQGEWRFLLDDGTFPAQGGVYPVDGRLSLVLERGRAARSVPSDVKSTAGMRIQDGILYPQAPGLVSLGDDTYLLNTDGAFSVGLQLVNRRLYLFDKRTGAMTKGAFGSSEEDYYVPASVGMQMISSGSFTYAYYFESLSGIVATGMIRDEGGDCYFADENGRLRSGLVDWEGNRYYFQSVDYTLVRDDLLVGIPDGDGTYTFLADSEGRLVTGWTEINDSLHYFDEKGHMLFDTIQDGLYINMFGEVRR